MFYIYLYESFRRGYKKGKKLKQKARHFLEPVDIAVPNGNITVKEGGFAGREVQSHDLRVSLDNSHRTLANLIVWVLQVMIIEGGP